jgi:protein phosphatase 2C family protein 2/3
MRKQNEDRKVCTYQLIKGEPVAYFGLYDGHGGEKVSEYLHQHLHHTIFDKLRKNVDMERSLADAFATTDDTIFKKQIDSGSTAVSVIIREKEVVIASVGDSQAILCSSGRALDFCVPHTPNLSSEKERIIAAKGTVVKGRIFGLLSVSRAFGDNDFKTSRGQFKDRFNGDLVSSSPDIVRHSISMEDEFIVLGCDGLFDVLEPQQVVDFVRTKLCQHGKIQQAAEELVAHAISIGSMDNVSAILVCFNQDYDAEKDI